MDNVILPEQRIDGFELDPESGVSSANVAPPPFSINPNDTYTVRWDGAVHICIAQSIGDGEEGTVFLGNGSIVGAVGNDEPFLIGVTGTQWVTYIAFDSQAYHTVGIWLGEVQPEEPDVENDANDIVLLSYSQTPVRYENVPKVWLTHPDSTEEEPVLVPFTFGEAVSKEVSPDFSGGDMAVEIPAGELVTGLTVKKPEELVPENIPEGMYIAGVGPGEFRGGAETVETTVALDFSGGDMVVTPEDGQSFSEVTIPKPENLSPENIAEGVKIAGVMGALAGGGMEVGTFGNLKYIIPIKEQILGNVYTISLAPMTYHRSTTEQIRVLLWPSPTYSPSSTAHRVVTSIEHGCTFVQKRSYTYPYAVSIVSKSGNALTVEASSGLAAQSGNLTEVAASKVNFTGDLAANRTYPSGWYYGVILVTDTAHSGPATILKENNYIESIYIQVIT